MTPRCEPRNWFAAYRGLYATVAYPEELETTPIQQGVLEAVREVLTELGAADAAARARLDSSLDRDLGLGSLERVELLMRVEKRFSRRLPDDVAQQAETPADLAAALADQDGAGPARKRYAIPPSPPAPAWPEHATDFVAVLRHYAETVPERTQIHLIESDAPTPISYGRLYQRSSEVAAGLIASGLKRGETVAIMLPTCAEFFYSFLGVSLAGGIAVPIYPPARPKQIEEYVQRQLAILANAEVRFLVSFPQAQIVADVMRLGLDSLREVVTVDELASRGARQAELREPAEIFFIQYTSGSTGNPKGVTLTHANVLANVRGIGAAVKARPTDVVVSWLPLYHDMGLIGSWLFSLYHGFPITVMSPLDFLSRPERWLWALSDSRGTLCPAPNFSYDLCTAKISDQAMEGVDLSPWRIAINAGEPVLASTLESFTARFAAWGFDPKAYVPCYGLAESSVALTFPPIDREPVIDAIDRGRFEQEGAAVPGNGDGLILRFVANGVALAGHEVKIVDEQGAPLDERVRGRILFRGPSRTSGYYRNLEASRAVIDDEGWMDSGDLGYVADGEVYVTGRLKDVIIKSGHNIIPQDVELAAAETTGVRKGCVAAFGSLDAKTGTERIIVVAETRVTDSAERQRIVREVTENVAAKVGIPPDVVQLAPPHAVPKTSSGKIRRAETRRLYEAGDIAGRKADAPWVQMVRLWAATAGGWSRRAGESSARWASRGATAAWQWGAAAAFGLPARLAPHPKAAAPLLRAGLRTVTGLNGSDGLSAKQPALYLVNRYDESDAAAWLTAIPGPAMIADSNALNGLAGPAAFLAEPLAVDVDHIADALAQGVSVIVPADSPAGEPPERCRFRLDAIEAAAKAGSPVVPGWRGDSGITTGDAIAPAASDLGSLRSLRNQVRTKLEVLTAGAKL